MVNHKQYNSCIDFIKGIACIFVVFMHCEFPGLLGVAIQAVSRFCVPFFFMVSGYFCYNDVNKKNNAEEDSDNWLLNKKVKHILKITINASLFYLIFVVIQSILFNNIDWNVNLTKWFRFILFNEPVIIAGQYWFLFALLYTYVIYSIIRRFRLYNYAYILAGLMFITYVILAQGLYLMNIDIPNRIYRNFLVEGFAYFMLGHWLHQYKNKIKTKNSLLLIVILITSLLCLLERRLLGRDFGVNIMTIPQVLCLFIYAINNPQKHEGVIQEIGKRYSMYIYILHPFVWHCLEFVYEYYHLSTNTFALYIMPILVLTISIVLSHFVYIVNVNFLTQQKKSHA